MIRAARREDFLALRDLERAAGEPFRGLGMAEVADDEPLTVEELAAFQLAGHAWVCADTGDIPVAYLLVRVINDGAHIEQLSVHPSHARRGLGAALLRFADGWAARHGLRALTLTTYAEVPWNAPYYQRLGFHMVSDDELGDDLRRIRDQEARRGLDKWPRVAMRRDVALRTPNGCELDRRS